MEVTLPPVAKSFFTMCKKCEADRYHRVLAHTTATSAKIECEICKSKKTYTLPKATTGKTAAKKTGTGTKAAGAKRSHTGDYEVRVQSAANKEGTAYSIKAKFSENEKISHPKFGIGFVLKVFDHKVDVIFSDEVKSLMHGR